MLMDKLYTLEQFESSENILTATIAINAGHKIFEGHFPGQPVLPGVCQLQIVKELLEKAVDKKLFLSEAIQCKFLQMVDPTVTTKVEVVIDYTSPGYHLDCDAILKSTEAVFLKMKGRFTIVD